MPSFNWDDLRFFLAATRGGSFTRAAKQLKVNESTVVRRIARFEADLGVRLMERSAGMLRPTQAGAAVLATAERIELDAQSLVGQVAGRDSQVAGTVRVTSVPILVNRILTPALPDFLRAHPALEIELIAEPRDLSLTKREADVALRLARPREETRNLARRIGTLDYAVYGPAQECQSPLPWVTYDDRMADLPQARWIEEQQQSSSPAAQLRVNDAEGLLQSLLAGLGKTLLPICVAEQLPGLVRLSGHPPAPKREIWLMTHPDLRQTARVSAVLDWLTSLFAASPQSGLIER